MLQTNVFANYLKELIETNTLEDYYNTVLTPTSLSLQKCSIKPIQE
jgi:hypothetical protein